MKKIYKNPTTEIVNIEVAQTIAESGPTINYGTDDYDGESEIQSRRGSLWDDED